MFEERKDKKSLVRENSISIDKPAKKLSSVSVFMDRVYSINVLHLLSATCQLLLGVMVVALSVLGNIGSPVLSTVFVSIGSISILVGCFFMYHIFSQTDAFDSLLHKAIKRVIDSQN